MLTRNGRAMVEGCDALLKNKEGVRARRVAAVRGHKRTARVCRRAEKTRSTLTDQLWAVRLYDFCTERRSSLTLQLAALAHDKAGVVPSAAFLQVVNRPSEAISGSCFCSDRKYKSR